LDWRSNGKVSSVKNQGSCGCCWAFSATATVESYFLIHNITTFDLAEEYFLECTGSNSTCSGGYMSAALNLSIKTGAPLESTYPYLAGSYSGVTFPMTPGICTVQ